MTRATPYNRDRSSAATSMIPALTLLLVFQLIGEIAVHALALPLPGPVLGMALLFGVLVLRGSAPAAVRETAGGLLQHLSLLFVPAGVGVMVHFARLGQEWVAIAVSLLVSTAAALAVTALVLRALLRRRGADR